MPFDVFSPSQPPAIPSDNSDLRMLYSARSQIAKGWLKGRYLDDLRVCAVGALTLASGHTYFTYPSRQERHVTRLLVHEIIHQPRHWCLFTYRKRLIMFNDHPKTTKADIMDLFNRAIHTQETLNAHRTVAEISANVQPTPVS